MRDYTLPTSSKQADASVDFEQLMTRGEVALKLSQCLRVVDGYIASGDLRVVRMGRSVRIHPEDLQEFVDVRRGEGR